MEYKQAGSETHQQEHRFEFPRAARQTKPFAERCSRARVRFAAPSAPLPTPAPFCNASRLRRAAPAGTQITRVMELFQKGRASSPLWLRIYLDISSLLMEGPE
jgi:hypothetical protein